MNDVADTRLSEAGARSLSRTRDSVSQSVYEVRHTDPTSFIDDLKADAALDAIEDKIVRLAIVNGPATLEQIEAPLFAPGGSRVSPLARSKYVTASYQARGQLVKLSAYCGVGWAVKDKQPSPFWLQKTKECALQLQSTLRQVQVHLLRLGVEVRGGGVYVEDPSDPWFGHYMTSIETPEPVLCRHCGEEIYFSNEAWRHVSTKRAEATVDAIGRSGNKIKRLDHLAEAPEDEAAS